MHISIENQLFNKAQFKLTNAQPSIIGLANGLNGNFSSFGSFGSSW